MIPRVRRARALVDTQCDADQSGVVVVWLALMIVVFLGVAAFAVDVAYWHLEKGRQQRAADAAALAGASAVDEDAYRSQGVVELDPALAEQRARAQLEAQLDRSALTSVEVQADREAITVVVRGGIGFTLLRLAEPSGDLPVRVTATATPRPTG